MENKTLKFKKHLAGMILAGEKYTTWRLFDDKHIMVGDVFDLIVSESRQCFATGEVCDVRETRFADLSEEDKNGHERFDSDDDMYATYTSYYRRPVGPETPLKVIKLIISVR